MVVEDLEVALDAQGTAHELAQAGESRRGNDTHGKATDATAEAEAQASKMLDEVRRIAAEESAKLQAEIDEQRRLYDALKSEVSTFRADILNRYKEQVSLIKDLPDLMPEIQLPPQQESFVAPVQAAFEAAEPVAAEPVVEPVVEPVIVEEEDDIPVAQISFIDSTPVAEESTTTAGSDLLKLMGDMQANEEQAAAAVEEVASLTAEAAPAVEPAPAASATTGFTILIDG